VGDLLTIPIGPRRDMRRGTPATAWYDLGCALERTDPAGAIAAYRRAIAGRPDFADAHNNLGRTLHDEGDLASAESHYRLAICAGPSVALYWFNLGVVVEDRGRNAEAIAAYERALELDPQASHGDTHYNLARLYDQIGRSIGDELAMRRAVRLFARYRAIERNSGL
jgi:tetratricopeptide (TPR) repeat protein